MKLFLLLSNLSKEELKILRKAVLSPLYNSNKKVVQLFELLRPKHPSFDDSKKSKEKLFKKLFPKEGFNDYKWRRVCMELTKVVEQVMIHIDTMENDFARRKQLKRIYGKRDLYPLFKKHTLELLAQLEAESIIYAEAYREKMDLFMELYGHHLHNKYDFKDESIVHAMEGLDVFYALQKMRLAIAVKERSNFLKKDNHIYFLESIRKEREEGFEPENILLTLYLQAIDFSAATSIDTFKTYEQHLVSNMELFEESDQKNLFKAGINCALRQNNRHKAGFKSYPFRWYKIGLENGLLYENNKLTEQTCINIVINGCKEKEFEWVEKFIETVGTNFHSKNPEAQALYFFGLLYFYKEDWDKALDYLLRCEQKTSSILQSRSIIIRVLFEKFLLDDSYLEILLANLSSFEVYLRRNKLFNEERISRYFTYILLMRAIARKVHANEPKASIKEWFAKKINNSGPLPAKTWMIKKVEEL